MAFSDAGLFVQAGLSKDSSRMDYVVVELVLLQRALKPVVAHTSGIAVIGLRPDPRQL